MRYLFLYLLLLTPALSFADVTITGIVSRDSDYFSIFDQDSGQQYGIDMSIKPGGSAYAQALAFLREMSKAVGHVTQLSGIFETLSVGETVFRVSADQIKILNSVVGAGTVNAYSSSNSGCADAVAVDPAIAMAKLNADSEGVKQCNGKAVQRVTDYQTGLETKFRGALCVVRAQATYICEQ